MTSGGRLLSTSGASTLMGCAEMVDVGRWMYEAARAAFDGADLVLVRADGTEIGRLTRSA